MKKALIEVRDMTIFILLVPIFVVVALLGFRHCWQCHEVKHRFVMKDYDCGFRYDKVCRDCHKLLKK